MAMVLMGMVIAMTATMMLQFLTMVKVKVLGMVVIRMRS